MVKNINQIRKLSSLLEHTTDENSRTILENQLIALMQEREEIKNIIASNEEGFSLFGWAFKLINGYPKDSIDNDKEEILKEEVNKVINNDQGEDEQKNNNQEKIETNNEIE